MTKRLQTDTPPSPPDLKKSEDSQSPEQAAPTEQEARLPFEQHAAGLGLAAWEQAAVKAAQDWPAGREVTLTEFQEALAAVHNEVIS